MIESDIRTTNTADMQQYPIPLQFRVINRSAKRCRQTKIPRHYNHATKAIINSIDNLSSLLIASVVGKEYYLNKIMAGNPAAISRRFNKIVGIRGAHANCMSQYARIEVDTPEGTLDAYNLIDRFVSQGREDDAIISAESVYNLLSSVTSDYIYGKLAALMGQATSERFAAYLLVLNKYPELVLSGEKRDALYELIAHGKFNEVFSLLEEYITPFLDEYGEDYGEAAQQSAILYDDETQSISQIIREGLYGFLRRKIGLET